ncbi:MAG: hypothetical protein JNM72_01290 [Deltaproteobacteria bacterium]|nr:hypothetical protein [Deltaproteobacteria bacterium]
MYGPPPDPLRHAVADGPADLPLAWALCIGLGVILVVHGLRRGLVAPSMPLLVGGLSLALLAPAPALGPTPWFGSLWWGEFPTIDKAGSYAFFRAGAHEGAWPWALPEGPALRLIGAHLGHLQLIGWVAALWPPHAAFGVVAVAQPALGWLCCALFLRGRGASPWSALAFGLHFGLGLHVMRDVNWYTIEKAAVYWLPLWLWLVDRSARRPAAVPLAALCFLWMAWNNLYLAVVGGLVGLGEGLRILPGLLRGAPPARRQLLALGLSALAPLPLLRAQAALLADNGPSLGGPARFLAERAALDVLSLWPPRWNRLELWRAVDPVAAGCAVLALPAALRRWEGKTAIITMLSMSALALGPRLALAPGEAGPPNPAYTLLLWLVPGAWRIAKPEVFFEGALLMVLLLGALHLSRRSRAVQISVFVAILVSWVLTVRSHPVYPGHSAHQELRLDPGWQERALRPPQTEGP